MNEDCKQHLRMFHDEWVRIGELVRQHREKKMPQRTQVQIVGSESNREPMFRLEPGDWFVLDGMPHVLVSKGERFLRTVSFEAGRAREHEYEFPASHDLVQVISGVTIEFRR